jgi:hypothetical protein
VAAKTSHEEEFRAANPPVSRKQGHHGVFAGSQDEEVRAQAEL